MKTRFSNKAALIITLVAFALVGCTRQGAERAAFIGSANAEPAPVVTAEAVDSATPATGLPEEQFPLPEVESVDQVVPQPAPGADEKPLPSLVRSNSPAADIVKMAQAGVDESVMLMFITNSTTPFSLSSDEIIYLNDIGVPNNVVTAMLQRDQVLKEYWANQAAPSVEANAAPSYVAPPAENTTPVEAPLTPPAQTVASTDVFYDSLSPYGTWIDIEGYGRCWQPTVVVLNSGWRPYADRGHWVYTDYGWYWMSDYSWGATTFHYGRWFCHPRWGWCWWPDRVWAPSWVTFRYGGDYCGWAPLPPHAYYRSGVGFTYYGRSVGLSFDFGLGAGYFTFVPWNRFCDTRPAHYRVPHTRVTQVFHNTTIVNNYVSVNNTTVVNRGIPADRVRQHSGAEIRQVHIRQVHNNNDRPGRREQFDGRTLVVNRPNIPTTRESSRALNPRGTSATTRDSRETSPVSRINEQRQSQTSGSVVVPPAIHRNSTDARRDGRTVENRARNLPGSVTESTTRDREASRRSDSTASAPRTPSVNATGPTRTPTVENRARNLPGRVTESTTSGHETPRRPEATASESRTPSVNSTEPARTRTESRGTPIVRQPPTVSQHNNGTIPAPIQPGQNGNNGRNTGRPLVVIGRQPSSQPQSVQQAPSAPSAPSAQPVTPQRNQSSPRQTHTWTPNSAQSSAPVVRQSPSQARTAPLTPSTPRYESRIASPHDTPSASPSRSPNYSFPRSSAPETFNRPSVPTPSPRATPSAPSVAPAPRAPSFTPRAPSPTVAPPASPRFETPSRVERPSPSVPSRSDTGRGQRHGRP